MHFQKIIRERKDIAKAVREFLKKFPKEETYNLYKD